MTPRTTAGVALLAVALFCCPAVARPIQYRAATVEQVKTLGRFLGRYLDRGLAEAYRQNGITSQAPKGTRWIEAKRTPFFPPADRLRSLALDLEAIQRDKPGSPTVTQRALEAGYQPAATITGSPVSGYRLTVVTANPVCVTKAPAQKAVYVLPGLAGGKYEEGRPLDLP